MNKDVEIRIICNEREIEYIKNATINHIKRFSVINIQEYTEESKKKKPKKIIRKELKKMIEDDSQW